MNQKLINQVRNEWRSNVWLVVELTVISIVLWYIVDSLFVTTSIYFEPRGFDYEHCYQITTDQLAPSHPDYKEPTDPEALYRDYEELKRRLELRPEVETAALSMNATPYNNSNSGGSYLLDTIRSSGYTIFRYISPEFPKVFRWHGTKGETPEKLSEILARGEILVSDNLLDYTMENPVSMTGYVGKQIAIQNDTAHPLTIGASLIPVRYNDYMHGEINRSIALDIPKSHFSLGGEVSIRVRAKMDRDVVKNLLADAEKLRVGNLFITGVTSFEDVRESHQHYKTTSIRNEIFIIAFLLVNIFLGILGTFWFRTRQRTGDIAVRKVNGATSGDIFRLLVGEGLILLTAATLLAFVGDINFAHAGIGQENDDFGFEWGRLLISVGIVYAVMAVMITLGILIPARKAMKTDPAEALRDE